MFNDECMVRIADEVRNPEPNEEYMKNKEATVIKELNIFKIVSLISLYEDRPN